MGLDKSVLLCAVALMGMSSFVHAEGLGDIEKDVSGNVLHMNQYNAEKYCLNQGSRLPTIREFAEESQKLGAKGIRETAYPGMWVMEDAVQDEIDQMDKDGYLVIYAKKGVDELAVDFYFNYSGYQTPAGEFGDYFFWSSSLHPDASNFVYASSGYNGGIDLGFRSYCSDFIAVRCVSSR